MNFIFAYLYIFHQSWGQSRLRFYGIEAFDTAKMCSHNNNNNNNNNNHHHHHHPKYFSGLTLILSLFIIQLKNPGCCELAWDPVQWNSAWCGMWLRCKSWKWCNISRRSGDIRGQKIGTEYSAERRLQGNFTTTTQAPALPMFRGTSYKTKSTKKNEMTRHSQINITTLNL